MRPWSPTGVCGPFAFFAVYCSTSLPPGVFSLRVTFDLSSPGERYRAQPAERAGGAAVAKTHRVL